MTTVEIVLKAVAAAGLLLNAARPCAQPRLETISKEEEEPRPLPATKALPRREGRRLARPDSRRASPAGVDRCDRHSATELAAIGGIGIRKIGSSQPIQVTDQMHIGSCTKAMTATMIGSLVEEGKLSWKSTFRDVFPESADQLHPQFQTVTLSHLLTHRAGLPHDGPWWNLPGADHNAAAACAHDEHAAKRTFDQAGLDLRLLERRLRPGRADGRAGYGRIVGELDAQRGCSSRWE